MSAPLGSIRTWSDAQLTEDVNDEDGINATKYNECRRQAKACKEEAERRVCKEAERHQAGEQWRVEAERHRVEEQAKKHVSCFWFVMTELMVFRWRRLLHDSAERARARWRSCWCAAGAQSMGLSANSGLVS